MRKQIHPDYKHLEQSFEALLNNDYTPDKVFCNKRNIVEKITVSGHEVVLKKYKKPFFLNRIVYSFFYKTKARRAYEHAIELLRLGIDTPFPIAYFEKKHFGLFHTGYFISEYKEASVLAELSDEDFFNGSPTLLARDFFDFIFSLYEKKILAIDFNRGNFFYRFNEASGHYEFAVTDINRMRFGKPVTYKELMHCVEKFGMPSKLLSYFVDELVKRMGVVDCECMYHFYAYRWRKKRWAVKKMLRLFSSKISCYIK